MERAICQKCLRFLSCKDKKYLINSIFLCQKCFEKLIKMEKNNEL